MQAGSLNRIINVWRNLGTVNSYGEKSDSWNVIGQHRASVTLQNAKRAFANGEVWYPRAAVFKVRLGADVMDGDRIYYQERYYDVVSVTIDELVDKSITINCEMHNE